MLQGLIGRSTVVGTLKESLGASAQRVRVIAHRVANATTPGAGEFAGALDAAEGAARPPVDLETEMVALADEQLRYDAAARLLQKVYAQVRSSVRGR